MNMLKIKLFILMKIFSIDSFFKRHKQEYFLRKIFFKFFILFYETSKNWNALTFFYSMIPHSIGFAWFLLSPNKTLLLYLTFFPNLFISCMDIKKIFSILVRRTSNNSRKWLQQNAVFENWGKNGGDRHWE